MPKNVVIDTGFWFALFNINDDHHQRALKIEKSIYLHSKFLMPWPTLYETLNTKFVGHEKWCKQLQRYLNEKTTEKIDDVKYRNGAIAKACNPKRPLSVTDYIIRCILDDPNVKTDALVTFNEKDFSDVCLKRNIELVSFN
jgi:predicted nucleic acid-binding protein